MAIEKIMNVPFIDNERWKKLINDTTDAVRNWNLPINDLNGSKRGTKNTIKEDFLSSCLKDHELTWVAAFEVVCFYLALLVWDKRADTKD